MWMVRPSEVLEIIDANPDIEVLNRCTDRIRIRRWSAMGLYCQTWPKGRFLSLNEVARFLGVPPAEVIWVTETDHDILAYDTGTNRMRYSLGQANKVKTRLGLANEQ